MAPRTITSAASAPSPPTAGPSRRSIPPPREAIADVAHGGPEDVDRAVEAARAAFEGAWAKVSPSKRHRDDATPSPTSLEGEPARARRARVARQRQADQRCAQVDVAAAVNHLRYYAGWPTKIEGETIPVSARDVLCLHAQGAGRRLRADHPLELPAADGHLEAGAGAGRRLHHGPEARRADAAHGPAPGRALPRGRDPRGRRERPHRRRRRPAPRSSSTPTSTRSPSPARPPSAARSAPSAARTLKRVTLELGGKCPNIILPDADLEAAIKGAYQGIYFNSGQACNAGSRLFVHSVALRRRSPRRSPSRPRKARVGPGLDPETELGPLVSAEQRERVLALHRLGPRGRRRAARRRRHDRRGRLLRRAHPVLRRQRRDADRP